MYFVYVFHTYSCISVTEETFHHPLSFVRKLLVFSTSEIPTGLFSLEARSFDSVFPHGRASMFI